MSPGPLALARASFACLGLALLLLTLAACLERRAQAHALAWWLSSRYARLAESCAVAGRCLLYAAAVLVGLAALPVVR